jgi:cell wall-associated NlpC family hydrolase
MIEWSDLDTPASVDEFIAAAKPPTGLETIRALLARDLAARARDEANEGVGPMTACAPLDGVSPRPGDILLIRGTNFWDRVVERVTQSPYGHCAMLVDPGVLIESLNRQGVRLTPVSTYTGDWYRAADALPGTQAAAIRAAVSRIGQPYGWGEAAHDWNRLLRGKLSPVDCSGLIAWAYREAGYPLTRRPYPTPGDLAWCETLTPLARTHPECEP